MFEVSTNALLASIRAIHRAMDEAQQRLKADDLGDEECEELGLYFTDLDEALSALCTEYEARRARDPGLTPVEALLGYFSR
jgi:hypothetical protein